MDIETMYYPQVDGITPTVIKQEVFDELKREMSKEIEDIVYHCGDCDQYNLCHYYHKRKDSSQICQYFRPSEKFSEWQRVNPLTDSMECSKCGYEIQSEELETPYCPWCGRKMKNWSDANEDTERDKVCS